MIGRFSDTSDRAFPVINANLYVAQNNPSEPASKEQTAQNILDLANNIPRPSVFPWKRKNDPLSRVAFLLSLHKQGFEAELDGRWERADFFWEFVLEEVKILVDRMDVWQALIDASVTLPDDTIITDPLEMRLRIVNEIFIDSHCAFYNGYIQNTKDLTWRGRAFAHVDYIKALLPFADCSDDDLRGLLGPSTDHQITLCEKAQRWDDAERLCKEALKYFSSSEHFQDRYAKIILANALSGLSNSKSTEKNAVDAKRLQQSIKRLERLRKDYPYSLGIFDALGVLYHVRAIKLANSNDLSEALVSIQKALTYSPGFEPAKKTQADLIKTMLDLQQQVKKMQAELRRRRNARLNATGLKLQSESQRGFRQMENWAKSSDARNVIERYYAIQGRKLWGDLKLPEPSGDWDLQARTLLINLSEVIAHPPDDAAKLPGVWAEKMAAQDILSDLDADLICTYLEARLFGTAELAETQSVEYPSPENYPLIKNTSTSRKPGKEPLHWWLISRQDMRIKLQAIVAIILFVLVGSLLVRDLFVRTTRNTAYMQVIEAAENQDALAVIEAAEIYVVNVPLSRVDERDQQVVDLYSQAFVQWFLGLESELDDNAQHHIERYESLIVDSERWGGDL